MILCHICDLNYSCIKELEEYVKNRHPSIKQRCQIHGCHYLFATTRGYLMHAHKHYGEKFYKCDFCNQIFSTVADKVEHENSHDVSEYEYRCQYCNRYEKRHSDFTKHLNWSCTKNPSRVISCMYCHEHITGILNFIKHLQKTHKYRGKFVCKRCLILFESDESLANHLLENNCKKGG